MKALEKAEKDAIKLRFAVTLHKLFEKSEFKSWKKLAKEAGMEPAHIQKIAAGKVDVALTTTLSLATSFGTTYSGIANEYESVTESDIREYLAKAERQKKHKGKSKIPVK